MKLTKKDKKAIAESDKVFSAIGSKLKKNSKKVKDKIDLGNIAKSLAERRAVIKEETEEEKEEEKED